MGVPYSFGLAIVKDADAFFVYDGKLYPSPFGRGFSALVGALLGGCYDLFSVLLAVVCVLRR
jgi:hypothetical protein